MSTPSLPPTTAPRAALLPDLAGYVSRLLPALDGVPHARREGLDPLVDFIANRLGAGAPVRLIFICTHNSRRSQMSEVWAATAAAYYGVADVFAFSGGTESTAFNPRAVAALRRAGFAVDASDGDNPRYAVSFSTAAPPQTCFSKAFGDEPNPQQQFAAIMTCSDADRSCPSVPGADLRLPIRYVDPKVADGTPEEAARYDERCRQIATELLYVFSRVAARRIGGHPGAPQ